MTTRRSITVTLTVPEAEALWDAAARGTDEWEVDNDDMPTPVHGRGKVAAAERARRKLSEQLVSEED